MLALVYKAGRRRGYGPFVAGCLAVLLIVGGKYYLEMNALAYGGALLLLMASGWNVWPQSKKGVMPKHKIGGREDDNKKD